MFFALITRLQHLILSGDIDAVKNSYAKPHVTDVELSHLVEFPSRKITPIDEVHAYRDNHQIAFQSSDLLYAVFSGNSVMFKVVAEGLKIDLTDISGLKNNIRFKDGRGLTHASMFSTDEMRNFLLELGLDFLEYNEAHIPPAHLAAAEGQLDGLQWLEQWSGGLENIQAP